MKRILLFAAVLVTFIASAPAKITWVAIGDSITYLNDHRDETGNRVTKGYLTLLTEKYPHVSYVNQGHNGWTSVNVADKIESLDIPSADVYTIFLGTNDWWGGKPLGKLANYQGNDGTGTVYGAFRVIVNKLRKLNGSAKIILITPMQRGDFVYINSAKNNAFGSYKTKKDQDLESFANAILEIGKAEKIPVVDLYHEKSLAQKHLVNFKRLRDPDTGNYRNYAYPEYTSIPFDPEKDEYPYPTEAVNVTYDGLHPSDKGYEVITKLLLRKWKGLK
jgi:lysophospholipase L1-like esterase